MLRKYPTVALALVAGLLLLEPSARAKDSQVLETLYRSESELNHQIDSLHKSYDLLSKSLKHQTTAAKSNTYVRLDKKYAREEILGQLVLLDCSDTADRIETK